jgi:hypothetical protein
MPRGGHHPGRREESRGGYAMSLAEVADALGITRGGVCMCERVAQAVANGPTFSKVPESEWI